MSWLLASAVLGVHLLAAGLASAGPLVCGWLLWRAERRGDSLAGAAGRRLAGWTIWALVTAMVLGGALLLLAWGRRDVHFWRACAAVPPARWWFGGAELLFSLTCLVVFRACWGRAGGLVWRNLLAVAAATNLLYHFPALFSIVALVADRPGGALDRLSPAEFRSLLVEPQVLAQALHFLLTALAVAGVAVLVLTAPRATEDEGGGPPAARGGAGLALAATLVQFIAGPWVLWTLPAAQWNTLLGGDGVAAVLLAVGVLLAAALVHLLLPAAGGGCRAREAHRVAVVLGLVVLLMSGVVVRVQQAGRQRAAEAAGVQGFGGSVFSTVSANSAGTCSS